MKLTIQDNYTDGFEYPMSSNLITESNSTPVILVGENGGEGNGRILGLEETQKYLSFLKSRKSSVYDKVEAYLKKHPESSLVLTAEHLFRKELRQDLPQNQDFPVIVIVEPKSGQNTFRPISIIERVSFTKLDPAEIYINGIDNRSGNDECLNKNVSSVDPKARKINGVLNKKPQTIPHNQYIFDVKGAVESKSIIGMSGSAVFDASLVKTHNQVIGVLSKVALTVKTASASDIPSHNDCLTPASVKSISVVVAR